MEFTDFEEEPMTSFMANINATNTWWYEWFFQERVLQNEDGKYALYNEDGHTFLLLKWNNGIVVPFYRSVSVTTSGWDIWTWFPYFWILDDGYISRTSSIDELENGYNSPCIQALQREINATLQYMHTHDKNGTLHESMPFLVGRMVRFSCDDHGPRDVPQAKDRSDVDAMIRYQEAWLEMIESAGEDDEYIQVFENTENIRASTKDGLSAVMDGHDAKRTEKS